MTIFQQQYLANKDANVSQRNMARLLPSLFYVWVVFYQCGFIVGRRHRAGNYFFRQWEKWNVSTCTCFPAASSHSKI